MNGFERAVAYLPSEMREILKRVPTSVCRRVQEIRLRADAPVTLSTPDREYWVTSTGDVSAVLTDRLLTADAQTVQACFEAMCDYSVHTHQAELKRGFITTANGLRVGVSGTTVVTDGAVTSMRRLTGLCIRVFRSHDGCARSLMPSVCDRHRVISTLICSEPSGGKTSLLRDLARQLSIGTSGHRYRVAVLDERGELSAGGRLAHCDVLLSCPKAHGIEQALRCLAPDVMVFDEIGTAEEANALAVGSHTGCAVIATVHARGLEDVKRRAVLNELLQNGVFEQVVLLKGRKAPGEVDCIVKRDEWMPKAVVR